jgi:predicted nuclease of predicted toxin-antitoxin system
MRLLIDANISPRVAARLHHAGHDATHVAGHGLLQASDHAILAHALAEGRVIVSADTDFTTMLALTGQPSPSLILLRSADHLTPDEQAGLLVANIPAVAKDLDSGAVVSLSPSRLRVRPLPLR